MQTATHTALADSDRSVLSYLAGLAGDDAKAWPTVRELASALGIGRSTVGDALKRLEAEALIDRAARAVSPQGLEALEADAEAEPVAAPVPARLANYFPQEAVTRIPLDRLVVSPLNPRESVDEATLAELAASIDSGRGLLQPLLVRPLDMDQSGGPAAEIVAGQRRFLALRLLAERGQIGADWLTPCVVRTMSDDEAFFAALAENLQRDALPPLDEGKKFAEYVDRHPGDRQATQRIADNIGKSVRYVQRRIRVWRNLDAELLDLHRAHVPFFIMEAIAAAPPDMQSMLVDDYYSGNLDHPSEIYQLIDRDNILPPVSHALFDLADYTGDILDEDHVEPAFVDVAQFRALQREAIQRKAGELEQAFAFCHVLNAKDYDVRDWRKPKKDEQAGALIVVDPDLLAHIIENVVKADSGPPAADRKAAAPASDNAGRDDVAGAVAPPNAEDGGSTAEGILLPAATSATAPAQSTAPAEAPATKRPSESVTAGAIVEAQKLKTAALQSAIAAEDGAGAAMAMTVLALLGCSAVKLGTLNIRAHDELQHGENEALEAVLAELLEPLRALDIYTPAKVGGTGFIHYADVMDDAAVFRWLMTHREHCAKLFAALVARQCGSWPAWQPVLGDDPLAIAAAETLGVSLAGDWRPSEAFLNKYRKPRLEQMARELKPHAEPSAKKPDIIADIVACPSRPDDWLPVELTFASRADMLAAIDGDGEAES